MHNMLLRKRHAFHGGFGNVLVRQMTASIVEINLNRLCFDYIDRYTYHQSIYGYF